ncbi:MAG TPA: replication-associated recombination protein A, partial [Clostridiales bacterium]|nr:replication-associated recombination protein A [Clostridiales bacterium]
ALNVVANEKTATIPSYLQDTHYKGAAKLGHGIGYKYAHNYKNHYVKQQYLPDELKDRVFYNPSDNGYEKDIKEYLELCQGDGVIDTK